jgi:uracil-DNA glycosylase family 4
MDIHTWRDLDNTIIACRKCERLVKWREYIARVRRRAFQDWQYWGKPVTGFGDQAARLLVIGLAPGAHGSNRTGRMFTGDASGDLLYKHLFAAGFANQPIARDREDGLVLKDLYISAICRCAPPNNKPTVEERKNCLPYLLTEIDLLKNLKVIVALGRVAYDTVLSIYQVDHGSGFKHGKIVQLRNEDLSMVVSYHPSRQNTQTGRLTSEMFAEIWGKVNDLLSSI